MVAAHRGPALEADKRPRWRYLEGSRREAEAIAALWKKSGRAELLEGADASEAALRQRLPGARYVHLATHGFFADAKFRSAFRHDVARERLERFGRPLSGKRATVTGRNPLLLSGVVLAGANLPQQTNEWGAPLGEDGILTGEEVAELDLRGSELVVLSACETRLGKAESEDVFGLQRAFHLAGARTTVASLWKVDDRATQRLMTLFYDNLWKNKLPKAEALCQAQLALLHDSKEAGRGRGFEAGTRAAAARCGPTRGCGRRGRSPVTPATCPAWPLSGSRIHRRFRRASRRRRAGLCVPGSWPWPAPFSASASPWSSGQLDGGKRNEPSRSHPAVSRPCIFPGSGGSTETL
jgi:CHAT domain-containing protein